MSKLTIKTQITLWYAFLTTAIMVILLTIILGIMYNTSVSNTHSRLKESIDTNFEEIVYEDQKLHIDDDIKPYHNRIYVSIYNSSGDLLYGYFPPFFRQRIPFENNTFQTFEYKGKSWYIYDETRSIEGRENITIRAVTKESEAEETIVYLMYFSFIALPVVVLAAAASGYFITKKAFRPIQKIQQTAFNIEKSRDLSRRINLGEGKDEIHQLSNTFDNMFDRIQESFENEKQFTSDASHELRTPTAAIMAQCEYALSYVDDIDEAKEVFETIFSESKKMNQLLSHLLLLARADQNTQMITLEDTNVSAVLINIIEILEPEIDKKHITVKKNIWPDVTIRADEMLLNRLFTNLISNAISYGKENGNLEVSLVKEDQKLIIKISDDGIGIAQENLDKIWRRFYQVEPARSSIEKGSSGLGLSIVKWIVQAHHGRVEVDSILGEGTTFTVYLPIQ